jgi:hypothetical protein
LWKGFQVEVAPGGSANRFFDHIRNLIPERDECEWFITWLAHLFQQPGKKTGICPVLIGGQGAGKGFLLEQMIGKLLGAHFFHTNDPKNDLFERFSEGRNCKLLVNIDDFNVGDIKMNNDPFKSLITGERINYEAKGKPKVSNFNCTNFVITTNNTVPVKIETDDRRYALLGCSTKLIGKFDYFDKLSAYWNRPENWYAVYEALMDFDITHYDLKRDRPMNKLYDDVKMMSAEKELLFLAAVVQGTKLMFSSAEFYEAYRSWILSGGFDYKPKNHVAFGMYMSKVDGIEKIHSNGSKFKIDKGVLGNTLGSKGIQIEGVCLLLD